VIRVAIDAMGGDHAPLAEIDGALQALAAWPGEFTVQLIGRPEVLAPALAERGASAHRAIEIIAASDVVTMADKPLAAIRKKPDSSLVVGLGRVRDGEADVAISAGNTGAILAGATLLFGLHDGVQRATVATLLPTAGEPVCVLDAGANVDCTARELVNFARLGSVYARDMLGRPDPAVALLNVGEEEEKGNAVAKEAFALLRETAGIRFVGNVEGRDVIAGHPKHGRVDVIVTDGFTGNVLLKFYESMKAVLVQLLQATAPHMLSNGGLEPLFKVLDYSQYGGAPLLGVRGNLIICHGSSNATAIQHAIRVALQSVRSGLSSHIGAVLADRPAADA
jgi:glycerol-3-phosphate acyltransferase PlsX